MPLIQDITMLPMGSRFLFWHQCSRHSRSASRRSRISNSSAPESAGGVKDQLCLPVSIAVWHSIIHRVYFVMQLQ